MSTLASSEDSDEMLHNAAFHQGLHCLPRQKQSLEKYYLEILVCDRVLIPQYNRYHGPSRRKNTLPA